MKNNHKIDFFSSPHTHLIPFLEIKPPYHDIYQQEEDNDQDKHFIIKQFNQYYQPIKPLNPNFFYDPLSEHEEEQSSQKAEDLFHGLTIKNQHYIERSEISSEKSNQKIEDEISYIQQFDNYQKDLFATPKKQRFIVSKIFEHTTMEKQKILSRSNQKGLRKLSSLAFSIVNSSNATTYKQVAERLLGRLNFESHHSDLNDEESRMQKSSMQNVKRRVYDSLNVLIALGVIKRAGNKITKQKQKKVKSLSLNNGSFQQNQKYQEMVENYQRNLVNLQSKRKTEKELKEKLQMFRKLIQRNKKTKIISKQNRLIKFPFLAFITKNLSSFNHSESHVKRIGIDNIQLGYEIVPQSYGDLDLVRLFKNTEQFQNYKSEALI